MTLVWELRGASELFAGHISDSGRAHMIHVNTLSLLRQEYVMIYSEAFRIPQDLAEPKTTDLSMFRAGPELGLFVAH